jgi:hypothetical protein
MGYNKNTSEIHFEYIDYNKDFILHQKKRIFEIIISQKIIKRIGNNSESWYECRFCDAKNICFSKSKVIENCRTCQYANAEEDGVWYCSKKIKLLSFKEQNKNHSCYKINSMFENI